MQFSRCKPEEVEAEKEKQQQQQGNPKAKSESVINSAVPISPRSLKVTDVEGSRIDFSNLTSTTTSAANNEVQRTSSMCSCIKLGNYRGSACFNTDCQHFNSVSDSFYSIQREASEQILGHENGLGVLLPLQTNVSFNTFGGYNQIRVETENSSPQTIHLRDENQEKDPDKVCLSAVERARQREIGKNPSRQQKPLKGDHIEAIKPSSKTTSDVALAFRSPHRQVLLLN